MDLGRCVAGDGLPPRAPADQTTAGAATADSSDRACCLSPDEIRLYLEAPDAGSVPVRVEGHIANCSSCRDRVLHVDDQVLDYVEGRCSPAQLRRIDQHLDECVPCRELVHHVIGSLETSDPNQPSVDGAGWITTFTARTLVNNRYLIRRFLGRGGMGEVYEAFDQLMGTRIALKTVLCTSADQPRSARLLKAEVLHAQRVGHPHVCRINELQEHRDGSSPHAVPFFTMEFIDGERLGVRIRKGDLSLDDIQTIAVQLLEGLQAAHSRGVLHLDFKSDNVMLRSGSSGPDAVIMDFGLSRGSGNEARPHTSDRHQLAGTLPYMALEQLECQDDLGPVTDVYAFGVVLYEMLTKKFPYDVSSLAALLREQLQGPPLPPSHFRPDVSAALDRFVLGCLSTDRRLRFADAERALEALRAVPFVRPLAKAQRPLGRKLAVAAVVVGALALGAAASRRTGNASTASGAATEASPASHVAQRTEGLSPEPTVQGDAPRSEARAIREQGAPMTPMTSMTPMTPMTSMTPMTPVIRTTPATPMTRATPVDDSRIERSTPVPPRAEEGGPAAAGSPPSITRHAKRHVDVSTRVPVPRPQTLPSPSDIEESAAGAAPASAAVDPMPERAPAVSSPTGGWKPTRYPRELARPSAPPP